MHPCDSRAALNGSALVLVNPPYLVEQEMREWLPEFRYAAWRSAIGLRGTGYQRTPLTTCVATASGTLAFCISTATLPSPAGSKTP